MSDQLITTEHRGSIFEIVLNRPEKRNALNWEMLKSLPEAVGKARRASGVRAIVVRGAGKGFSAGIDPNTFFELPNLYGPQ